MENKQKGNHGNQFSLPPLSLLTNQEYGFFHPIIKEVVEHYLDCGTPRCGFTPIRCPACGEEPLLVFSCRTRGFCPSCHAKRPEEWGEWMRQELLLNVPQADLCRGQAPAADRLSGELLMAAEAGGECF